MFKDILKIITPLIIEGFINSIKNLFNKKTKSDEKCSFDNKNVS